MAHFIRLILLLLVTLSASGQGSTESSRHFSRINLKLAPLALLDPDATVQGAVEFWLKQR